MVNRFMTARSTVEMRRWGGPAIVTLAAMAATAALTADAAARGAPAPPPRRRRRDAGEPIMAIVSIKTSRSLRRRGLDPAPVSTGTTGREACWHLRRHQKDKDHHSSLYDVPGCRHAAHRGAASLSGPLPVWARTAACGCPRLAEQLFDKTRMVCSDHLPNDRPRSSFPSRAIRAEREGRRRCSGAPKLARAGRAARRPTRRKAAATAARRTSLTASLRKLGGKTRAAAELAFAGGILAAAKTDKLRRRPRAEGEGRRQGRGSGDAARHRQGRREVEAHTPPPPQRTPPKWPRPRRPIPPRRRARRSRARAGLGLHQPPARTSSTCGAILISSGWTGARCSMRPSRFQSRSAIPTSGSRRICSLAMARKRGAPALDRGHDRRRGRRQRTRSTASPSRRMCSIASRRLHCAILDRRLGRAAEPRDHPSHRVRRGAEQPAPGRLLMRRPTVDVPVASGNDWGTTASASFSSPIGTPNLQYTSRAGQYYQPMQQRWYTDRARRAWPHVAQGQS